MAQVINNNSGGPNSKGNGSGVVPRRSAFGSITVAGKANEVFYMDTQGLFLQGHVFQGIWVQVTDGAVAIGATLVPADLAVNPTQQSVGTYWGPSDDSFGISDGMKKHSKPFATALRLTFGSAGGTVHISGA